MTGDPFARLAAAAEWLDQYGAIAWASAGLLAAFVFVWLCAGAAGLKLWLAQARYKAAKSKKHECR